MRTLPALVGLCLLGSVPLCAQHRWQVLDAPTSPRLTVDLLTLRADGPIVSIDVRAAIGPDLYEIQPHEVRCTDSSVRLGPARPYDPGTRESPLPPRSGSTSAWIRYSPNSDGHLTALAICALARRRGLLRQQTTSLG